MDNFVSFLGEATELINSVPTWVYTLVTATFAAYIGSYFALKKSKYEKVWFQKQEAYLSIIESLHNITIWADKKYVEAFPYPVPFPSAGKEELIELQAKQKLSLDILRKHVHLGGLVVSKGASKKLEELLKEYDSEVSDAIEQPFQGDIDTMVELAEHYTRLEIITRKYIDEVRNIAKKDLKL